MGKVSLLLLTCSLPSSLQSPWQVTSFPLSLSCLLCKMGVVTARSSGSWEDWVRAGVWPNNMPLHGQTAFSIYQLVDNWVVSTFWLLQIMLWAFMCSYVGIQILVDRSFHFSWVCTQQWNCWAIFNSTSKLLMTCQSVIQRGCTMYIPSSNI